jgi:hypothetical protein
METAVDVDIDAEEPLIRKRKSADDSQLLPTHATSNTTASAAELDGNNIGNGIKSQHRSSSSVDTFNLNALASALEGRGDDMSGTSQLTLLSTTNSVAAPSPSLSRPSMKEEHPDSMASYMIFENGGRSNSNSKMENSSSATTTIEQLQTAVATSTTQPQPQQQKNSDQSTTSSPYLTIEVTRICDAFEGKDQKKFKVNLNAYEHDVILLSLKPVKTVTRHLRY